MGSQIVPTHSKKSLAVDSVVIFFLQATIMAIFENLLMTKNTKSLLCLVEGVKFVICLAKTLVFHFIFHNKII